jgi:hypothetical protein
MPALPKLATSLAALRQLQDVDFESRTAAIARFADKVDRLEAAGCAQPA